MAPAAMNSPDEAHLDPYREAVERLGPGAPGYRAALWGSRESQVLRFDVMIDMAGFDGCALLDIGCGTGDFAQHLIEREVDFSRYIGIDAVAELIQNARERGLPEPECEFHVRNALAALDSLKDFEPDFTVLSGTLNTMDEAAARKLVQAAFDASAQGVVFNFLSDRPHPDWLKRDIGPARRFNTVAWLDWAMRLTPRVRFTQDYMNGHDATVMLRH